MPAIVGDLLQQFLGLHGAGVSGLRSDPAPQLYRQGVGRAGTVHSEPSTAVGVNHKTAHLIGGQPNGISPNAQKGPILLDSPPPVGWRWGRAVCRWELSHRPCYRAINKTNRLRAAQHWRSRRWL